MKVLPAILFLAFALPAFGQSQPANTAVAPGCGPANITFDVKTDNNQHPTAQPDAGKAILYFLQDDADFDSRSEAYDSVWTRRRMDWRDAQRFLFLCFG